MVKSSRRCGRSDWKELLLPTTYRLLEATGLWIRPTLRCKTWECGGYVCAQHVGMEPCSARNSMLGGIFAPISPFWNTDEVAFQLRDSGATVLFTVPPLYDLAQAAVNGTSVRHIYVFGGCEGANPFGSLLQNEGWMPEDDLLEAFDDTDVCLYCYTPVGGGELQRFEASHIEILSSLTSIVGRVNEPEQDGGTDVSVNEFELEDTDKVAGALPFWRSEGLVGGCFIQILQVPQCTPLIIFPRTKF